MTTALVLSAGGMFGAWEVGVWKVLRRHIHFDLIVGASAGAWNGWAIAGGATPEELAAEWLDPLTASLMQFGLHRSGVLRPDALFAKARDLAARYQPRLPFGLTIVEIPRLRVRLVRDSQIGWEHLAATCAIPFAFPPLRIQGKSYVDGGLLGSLPLWAAEEMGATRAIGVNCLTTWHFRTLRKTMPPRQPSPALQVVRIEPSAPLGLLRDAVVWTPANIERWIGMGEQDAARLLDSMDL